MKKHILIVGIMLVLFVFILSGCTSDQTTTDDESNGGANGGGNGTETTDDPTKFYGTWIEEDVPGSNGETRTIRHTFSSDGTYTFEILERDISDTGTWVLEDGQLTTNTNSVNIYTYSFSDNDTTLTLTTTDNVSQVFTKQ